MTPHRAFMLPLGVVTVLSGLSCSPEERDFNGGAGSAEACFDGIDNDGDSDADCADADCDAGAACVASPEGLTIGVLVAEGEACPEGFVAEDRLLHRGLVDPGCEGCGCTADPVGCTVDVYYYETDTSCFDDTPKTGGTFAGDYGFTCDANNPIYPMSGGLVRGIRAGTFKVVEGCTASGDPKPAAPAWQETRRFCRAELMGTGCDAGQACVPRQAPAAQCALAEGAAACEGYPAAQEWYSGVDDTRVCDACICDASGGSCDGVFVQIGSDYSCINAATIGQDEKTCQTIYAPPIGLVGNPLPSTCTAGAAAAGALLPAGPSTLCCMQ
jgi:hypothetical protein